MVNCNNRNKKIYISLSFNKSYLVYEPVEAITVTYIGY